MASCNKTNMLMKAIKKAGGGKVQTSADTARKLAQQMGGMKKGGKAVVEKATGERYASKAAMAKHEARETPAMQKAERKNGLAVMIAIGKPEKKKKGGMPVESISSRPTGPGGRQMTMADLEKANRDTGGMTAAQIKAAGEAIARGNRTPYEPIPKTAKPIKRAQGGAAKVRKGMMSPSGQILQAVKPKKK